MDPDDQAAKGLLPRHGPPPRDRRHRHPAEFGAGRVVQLLLRGQRERRPGRTGVNVWIFFSQNIFVEEFLVLAGMVLRD